MRRWWRRPTILVWALVILSLGLFWSLTLATLIAERRTALRTAATETTRLVSLMEADALRTLDGVRAMVNAIDLWLETAARTSPPPPLDDLAPTLAAMRHGLSVSGDIRLFEAEGLMIPFGGEGNRLVSASAREFFQLLRNKPAHEWVIGVPLVAGDTGNLLIPMARRAPDNPYGAGVIALGLPVRRFSSLYQSVQIGDGGRMQLVRLDGALLTSHPLRLDTLGTSGWAAPELATLIAQGRAADGRMIRDADGRQSLVSLRPLANYPLIVVASLAVEDVLAVQTARQRIALILTGVASLVVIGSALVIVRLLRRREREAAQLSEALAAAQAASEAKSNFLAKMSHELRTPLNAILGFSEIISGAFFGPVADRYRDYAGDIRRSGQHLLSLINDILDVARIEAGAQELHSEPLDIPALIRDTAAMLTERAHRQGVILEEDLASNFPPMLADRRAVLQMLLNLYGNAIKFSPAGAVVTGAARIRSNGDLVVEVIDNGPGIPLSDLDRVTQPFGRGRSATTTAIEGTGLGLAITKGLIELHGGRFDLISRPGEGVTARLVFPANRALGTLPAA